MIHFGLNHFLFVSCLLFGIGLITVVTKRNSVLILIGVELMFTSACLNFVTFGKFSSQTFEGQTIALFTIFIIVVQSVIGFFIVREMKTRKTKQL